MTPRPKPDLFNHRGSGLSQGDLDHIEARRTSRQPGLHGRKSKGRTPSRPSPESASAAGAAATLSRSRTFGNWRARMDRSAASSRSAQRIKRSTVSVSLAAEGITNTGQAQIGALAHSGYMPNLPRLAEQPLRAAAAQSLQRDAEDPATGLVTAGGHHDSLRQDRAIAPPIQPSSAVR